MTGFDIGREQQKIFIEHFVKQVLELSLQLVDEGKERDSPGATFQAIGRAVASQLYGMGSGKESSDA